MPLNFPSSPTTNTTYTFNSKTWTYNGNAWALSTGGSLNTSVVPEGSNLYFSNARVYSNVSQLGYLTSSSLSGYATNAQLTSYATTSNVALKANIADLTAANITGTTLNSSIVNSSLTSVGTLGSLTVTNNVNSGATLTTGNSTAANYQSTGNVNTGNIRVTTNSTLGTVVSGSWNGASITTAYTDAKVTSVNGQTGAATGFATTANSLSQFASTTSSQLATLISDETGSGALVFGTSPAITTSLTTPSTSFDLVNTTATTVNFAKAATTLSIGASTGTTTVNNDLVITGNVTVNGTTETINSVTYTVDDKNIELGSVATPTDVTAEGGGITLKGATDKTFNWVGATTAWTSSEDLNLLTGKAFKIAGTSVLNGSTLGSGVVNSSLTSVGTLGSLAVTNNVSAGAYLTSGSSTAGTFQTAGNVNSNNLRVVTASSLGTVQSGTWNGSSISTTYTDAKVTSVNGSTGAITGLATTAGTLAQFGATTSAQLAGVVSDETGSGALVFATSPSLTTPTLGVASATTVNKVTITTPLTGSTLTIADGKTLTASNTLTFTGTDTSSVAFGSGGTVLYSGGALGTPSSGTLTNCTFPTLNQNTTGSAATLTTSRNINGVAFNGSADITVTAAAGTLSGATLASGVTASSLTSVGTLTSLAVTNNVSAGAFLTTGSSTAGTFQTAGNVNSSSLRVTTASSLGTVQSGTWNGSSISTTYTDAKVTSVNGGTGAITGLATTAGTLAQFGATTSSQLAGVISDETGSGALVFATSPTLVTPALGTPSSGTLTNCTFPTLNQDTTGSAASAPLVSALGNYVWSTSTAPSAYNQGIQSSFVSDASGFPSYGSVMTMKTYSGGGGTLQMYVPYSPTYGGTGIRVRFGNYDAGDTWTSFKTLLASDNYNSYAPTLTGTGASGTWGISISGSAATTGGFTPSQTAGAASRVVVADSNGYIFNSYFNSTDDTSSTGLTYIMGKFGDNYLRSASAAKVATFISGQSMNIAGTATNATNSTVTDDTTTNATHYPNFVSGTSGNQAEKVSSTKFTFNPSTGLLTTTDYNSSSDKRLKKNIKTVDNALDKVMALRGVSFDWKEGGSKAIGLIAQEAEKVIPEIVSKDDNGYLGIKYNNLIGVLVEAIKDQQEQINILKKQIEKL